MSMSTNLCDLPPELLVDIVKRAKDLDAKSAANFIKCSKQLRLSDALSGLVAKLVVDLREKENEADDTTTCHADRLRQRILAFPSHGKAAVRTLVIKQEERKKEEKKTYALAAALEREDVAQKLAQLHTLDISYQEATTLVPSLRWLTNMLQRGYAGLRRLEITVADTSLPPSAFTSSFSCAHLKTLILTVVEGGESRTTPSRNLCAMPLLFPRLEVLHVLLDDYEEWSISETTRLRIPRSFYGNLERLTSLRELCLGAFYTSSSVPVDAVYGLLSGRLPHLQHLELPFVSIEPAPPGTPPPRPEASRIRSITIGERLNYGAIVHLLPLLPRLPQLAQLEVCDIDLHVSHAAEIRANIHHLGCWTNSSIYFRVYLNNPKEKYVSMRDEREMPQSNDWSTRASWVRTMLEPLKGSAFAESITAIKYEMVLGVPDVVREWAAVFPNVETLEWKCFQGSDEPPDECALASVMVWPRLRCVRTLIDNDYTAFLPALSFARENGRHVCFESRY